LPRAALEADIQVAWSRASAVLPCADFDANEVAGLVVSLRDCAKRASAIGFASGERELLRMARFLEGRISQSDYPQYRTDALYCRSRQANKRCCQSS